MLVPWNCGCIGMVVGGGDGKIIPPIWLGELPTKGERGVGPPFEERQILEGRPSHIPRGG